MGPKYIPFIVWCGLITWLSHTPGDAFPMLLPFPGADKLVHLFLFFWVGLSATWPSQATRWKAIFLGIAFACCDELHQSFVPGRQAELWDLVADGLGVVCGNAFLLHLKQKKGL